MQRLEMLKSPIRSSILFIEMLNPYTTAFVSIKTIIKGWRQVFVIYFFISLHSFILPAEPTRRKLYKCAPLFKM